MQIKPTLITLSLVSILSLSGCVIHVGGDSFSQSSILDNIELDDHQTAGDLSSVNGNIRLDDHASARELNTVNGTIVLAEHTRAVSVTTVNGSIDISQHSQVSANVTSVNGSIEIDEAIIGGNVESVNGDIFLRDNTVIEGDIVIRANNSWFADNDGKGPRLVIASGVKVYGQIIFERPVQVEIDSAELKAKIIERRKS